MAKLILLYFGTIILAYLSQVYYPVKANNTLDRHFMRDKTDIFCWAIIVWMTCFSFLRTSYNDTANYIFFWKNANNVKEFVLNGNLFDLTGNPLSLLWESFAHTYISNYHIYFFPPALLCYFAAVKLIKKYSVKPSFSFLIFFSIGTYIMYMAAMKQSIAMFFLLLSIPYAEKRKYLQFYILVFIAVLFHTHAFMFAIVPLLFEKPWGKITWIGFGIALFCIATYDVTLGAFMKFAQSLGALVADIEVFDGHQINIIRVIVYWIPTVMALVFRKRLFNNSTRIENLFVNMSIVSSIILMIGVVQAANLFARMAAYFEFAQAIVLPWMINKLFTRKSQKWIVSIACICYFIYFLYEFGVSKNFANDYASISILEFIIELVKGN